MTDGTIEIRDHFYGENQVQVFRSPVLFDGAFDVDDLFGFLAAPDFNAFPCQGFLDLRQENRGDISMNQKGFSGVAHRNVLAFAVNRNFYRHVNVRFPVDIDMADAIGMSQHGDPGVVHDITDKRIASPGYDKIDIVIQRQHCRHILAGGEEADPTIGNPRLEARPPDDPGQDPVGLFRLTAAFQQYGIAALQAEGRDLHQCIRAGLENNANHPDGAGYPIQFQSLIQFRCRNRSAHRVR